MKRPLLTTLLLCSVVVHSQAIPSRLAVRAIVGEASNQSDQAMLAVASAIRHRGSLQGVYGVSSPVTQHASAAVWARARRAWHQSAQVDAAHGCKFFGCPADAPYFRQTLHFRAIFTIGAITFYKP